MPPLNTCEEQVDPYYSPSNSASRANSPFDDEDDEEDFLEDDLDDDIKEEKEEYSEEKNPERPLFLNFNADLNPQNTTKKPKPKKATTYKVNGVNILNRKSLDSKTVMERLKRRRENHNHVERKRRDNINHTILEISQLIPHEAATNAKLNKGSILRLAADYIKEIQAENRRLATEVERNKAGSRIPSNTEQVGYPVRPYTQLLHDQPSYPVPHQMRGIYENPHYLPSEAGHSIGGYRQNNNTSHLAENYMNSSNTNSQSIHRTHLAASHPLQHTMPQSQPLHASTPALAHTHSISYQQQQPRHTHQHGHNPSVHTYPPVSLPHSNNSQLNGPVYGYNTTASGVQHTLPPLSAQQQRKGMMFNEFSGTLNLF
ncbi:hypothetical protein K7432_001974 [Basidiobolus ranarum]|uniref:BHLH domain-containing protein n=1 Tax=Basidiobolus ranarum TaxID=34480 RepID=A0ABR2X299_9FUNG